MDAETIIAKGKQHIQTVANGETVLMHTESGRFFSLSGTGRRVWDGMGAPIAVGALVDRLSQEFAVQREICLRDVLALCHQLEAGGLIDVSP